jgi:2-polyprenyl-3-methyl-5-hydroxy-6-metoxy-1,4-benzoquinol methylase
MSRARDFYDRYWEWRSGQYDYHKLGITPLRHVVATQFIRETIPSFGSDRRLRLVDLGCGEGILGKLLSESEMSDKLCTLGIDISDIAAELSNEYYDETRVLDVDLSLSEVTGQKYDYVVSLEVIEHIFSPAKFLQTARTLLNEHGYLVISTPNFAHYTNRLTVLRGAFPDETHIFSAAEHIHYFTFYSFSALLSESGFGIIKYDGTYQVPGLVHRLLRSKTSRKLFLAQPNLFGKQIVFLCKESGSES